MAKKYKHRKRDVRATHKRDIIGESIVIATWLG